MSVKQYDRFIPLFTSKAGDNRSNFFLSELKHAANAKRNVAHRANFAASDLKLDDKTNPSFIAKFFLDQEGKGDNDVHPSWIRFVAAFANARAGKKQSDADASGVLAIIKSVANPAAGSIDELVQLMLVELLEEVKDGSGKNIKANASQWGSASTFEFKSSTNIRTALLTFFDSGIVDATKLGHVADATLASLDGLVPISVFKASTEPTVASAADWAAVATAVTSKATVASAVQALVKSYIANEKAFGYKYDKYFVSRVLADAAEGPVPSGVSSWFSEQDDVPKEYKYYRKADGRLYMRTPAGVEEAVDSKSDAVAKLSVSNKCIGTGFADASGKTCGDYLQQCLEGGDVKECKDFLKDKSFWANAEAEVESMLPPIALKTLQAFEFKREEYFDETAGRKLYRIISYPQWIAKLAEMVGSSSTSKLDKATFDLIAANDKLQGYLEMLVKKVNANPGILNKDYVGATDSQKVNDPKAFNGTRLARMGLTPRYAVDVLAPSSFERMRVAQQDTSNRVRLSVGLSNTTATPFTLVLSGGSGIERNEEYLADASKQLHTMLARQYLALVERLRSRGKEIAADDAKKITQLLEELKQKETKLVKLVLMTEKYASLLEVHGQHDPTGTITINHLKEFVDQRNQYFQRVAKKQSDLISIIKSISEAFNKDTPKEEKKTESKMSDLTVSNLLG